MKNVTVSVPSLAVCSKQRRDPEVYFHVCNMAAISPSPKTEYRMLLAVEAELYNATDGDAVVSGLRRMVQPTHLFSKTRPWAYMFGDSEKDTCPIQDYEIVMPMYNELEGEPIGPPQHGWVDLLDSEQGRDQDASE